MTKKWHRYFVTALFALAFVTAGYAARDVEVSQRGPIRGEATIEGDKSTTTTQSEESKKKASGSVSGSASGSAGASAGSRSSSTPE